MAIDNGGPAFPRSAGDVAEGMSFADYVAAHIAAAIIPKAHMNVTGEADYREHSRKIAEIAYTVADALCQRRRFERSDHFHGS